MERTYAALSPPSLPLHSAIHALIHTPLGRYCHARCFQPHWEQCKIGIKCPRKQQQTRMEGDSDYKPFGH